MDLWQPDSFQEVAERAAREGWTRLAATPNRLHADRLVEKGWPADRVALLPGPLTADDAEPFSGLTKLTTLDLWDNNLGEAGAAHLAGLTGLTTLNLANNKLGDAGAAHLAGLTGLTTLDLGYNNLGEAGAAHLAGLTGLTTLDLGGNNLGEAGAAHLAGLTGLTTLNLGHNNLGEAGAAHLAGLTGLTTLDLGGNNLGDAGAAHLAGLTGLTTLDLWDNNLGDAGAAHLAGLTGLTTLKLWDNNLGDAGAAHLAGLTGLTTLDLRNNNLGEAGAAHLAGLTGLTTLDLGGNNLGDAGAAHLAGLTGLTTLDLWDNNLGDAGAAHLAGLTGLTTLDLAYNDLGEAGAAHLAGLTNLTTLDLWNNDLGEAGAAHLASLTNLTTLNLRNNNLGDAGAAHLASLTNLTTLNLWNNNLGEAGAAHLASLTNLTTLNLWNNNLGEAGAAHLAGLANLTTLNLENNDLGDAGAAHLSGLTELVTLNLLRNRITSLPNGFARLDRLERLYLAGNDIEGLPPEMLLVEKPFEDEDEPTARQILDYYFRLREQEEEGQARPLNEAKILVVGEPGVGKTDLTHWLIHGRPHPNPKTTEGIQIERWAPDGEDGVQINVWDFGGQEIMRATHQFFLTERSLYLLVLDSRENEEQGKVRAWLERIRAFGDDAPVLVVLNKVDEGGLKLNETQLSADYPENLGDDRGVFFRTACRGSDHVTEGAGIDALKARILESVRDLDGVRQPLLPEFHAAKVTIEREASAQSKLTRDRFSELCVDHGMAGPEDQRLLLLYLKNLGSLFHYHRHPSEGRKARTYVLDPEWLTAGVYAILTNHALAERGGILTQRELPEIFASSAATKGRTYDDEDRDFVLDMMEGDPFHLCFTLPDEPERRWLVPQLLPPNTPPHGIRREKGVALRYRYPYLPPGLVPRFIVRTHGYLQEGDAWRDGVVLTVDGARVLVLGVPGQNYLDVITEDRSIEARRAMQFVRHEIKLIHHAMRLEGVKIWLTPPNHPDDRILLAKLYTWRDDPKRGPEFKTQPEDAEDDYTVGELLDYLEQGAPSRSDDRDLKAGLSDLEREIKNLRHESAERHEQVRSDQLEMKTQNDEILKQGRDHHQALVGLLLDEAKDGPRLFSFRALDPKFFDRPKWASTKFRITLWCEHAHVPLPAINGLNDKRGVYEIDVPRDWLLKAAPTLKLLAATLGTLLPVGAAAAKLAIDEGTYPQIGDQLKLGETTANALIKAGGKSVDALASESGAPTPAGGPGSIRANGPTLRQLQDWLKNEDASFGGLERVRDAGGGILWVHPRYKGEYTGSA